jgi:hypothetical protein
LKFVKLGDDSYSNYKLKYINFGLVNFLIILVVFIILSFLFKDFTFLLLIIPFIALTRMFINKVGAREDFIYEQSYHSFYQDV